MEYYGQGGEFNFDGVQDEGRSVEPDAEECQARCEDTDGCKYFSFFGGDGGCHLTSEGAMPYEQHGWGPIVSGGRDCNIPEDAKKSHVEAH